MSDVNVETVGGNVKVGMRVHDQRKLAWVALGNTYRP